MPTHGCVLVCAVSPITSFTPYLVLFYTHQQVNYAYTVFKADQPLPFPYELVCTYTACDLTRMCKGLIVWAVIGDFMVMTGWGITARMRLCPIAVIPSPNTILCLWDMII